MKAMFCVYGIYSKKGALIYVGCTRNLESRLSMHRTTGRFGRMYQSHEVLSWHENRADALKDEKRLIRAHQPMLNINGNSSPSKLARKYQSKNFALFVRIHDAALFIRLAGLNRRSCEGEANIAVERHVASAANQKILQNGPKKPRSKSK